MLKLSKWLLPQILIILILGFRIEVILSFFWIIVHELCHYFVARTLGVQVDQFKIHPLGTAIQLRSIDELSHKEELMIFSAGPIVNLIAAIVFFIIYKYCPWHIFYQCVEINLTLGIFNLIPAMPLDGSKLLKSILSVKMLYKKSHSITVYASYVFSVIFIGFFFLSVYLHKMNICFILVAIMIAIESHKEKGRVMYIIMGDVVKKKTKFLKNKYMINRMVSVYCKESLLNLLGYTNKNRYHIFYILNDNMDVIGKISEGEVVEVLKKHGNITLQEYICLKDENTLV